MKMFKLGPFREMACTVGFETVVRLPKVHKSVKYSFNHDFEAKLCLTQLNLNGNQLSYPTWKG